MIPQQLQKDELKFCRIRKGTKVPFEKEWTKKPYSFQEIMQFMPEENYGVLCGFGNLAVIDCDKPELQLAIDEVLPKTFKIKTGGRGTHNYFFVPKLKKKIVLEIEGIHLGEIQSYGSQVVGPNCIHPSGNKYEVMEDKEIAMISYIELMDVIKPFIKEMRETEETAKWERQNYSEIDNLSITDIWNLSELRKHGNEYYGSHPIHGSETGMNFWVNPLKNTWHCFRCNSGGGALSALAVKEGIISCVEAQRGVLRGEKARVAIEIAKDKYNLKGEYKKIQEIQPINRDDKAKIIWDDELQNYVEEEKGWIIENLISNKSVCILTGKRGTLKTFIALSMGYSVATGKPFLKHFKTIKGSVIYLDKENGIGIMKKRTKLIKEGMDIKEEKDIKIGFICFSQIKIDRDSDIEIIEKMIKEHNPILLIIDTYRRGISFDENDAGEVSRLFVDVLRPLVEKYDISILLIHHNRKGASGEVGDEMDEIRGSSDLANYADIILKMERRKGEVVLKQLKNRNMAEINPIKIENLFEDNSINLEYSGEYEKHTQEERCIEILTLWMIENNIKQFKTKDAKEIAFRAGIKETNFKNSLVTMRDIGVIKDVGFGLYEVSKQEAEKVED